jgi:hypothetical protein
MIAKLARSRYFSHYKMYTPLYTIIITVGPYLILVTNKKFVGNIDGHSVYEVTGTELIPFSKTNIHLSESQVNYKVFVCMLL